MAVMPMFPLGSVLLPNGVLSLHVFEPRYRALVTECVAAEHHEFGVVLMIGGNLPGITRVASVQIYDHVEALEYLQAHRLSAVMLGFSFVVLLALYAWRPQPRKGG